MKDTDDHQHGHETHEQHSDSHHVQYSDSPHEQHSDSPHEQHSDSPHEHTEHSDHVEHGDHAEHADHSGHGHHHADFKTLFFRSLPIGIIIMLLSPMMGVTLPLQFTFPYSDIVVAVLATVLLIYGGRPFYQGAAMEFKDRKPGMMALISLGVTVSYIYSIYAVIAGYLSDMHVMDFFFEFASLLLVMLLGHWVEMKAVGEAGNAQKALAELVPKDAHVLLGDDSVETRPVASLQIGEIVRVQAGENVPADGIITRGESQVNESLLTGESTPVDKKVGDQVIGGSTNGSSVLFVEVRETGKTSFISQVQDLITKAQSQPSRAEDLAQKVAGWLFYIAVIVAVIALIVWLAIADLRIAITFTVTTLVIACPHALGLAIPLLVARSTSLGAGRGLLVKDRKALEITTKADVMVLDKTGTLTSGEFRVLEINVMSDRYSREEIIALMAGIEGGSSHPIAQSIIGFAHEEEVVPRPFESIEVISGSGIKGLSDGKAYKLISRSSFGKTVDLKTPVGATLSILVEDEEAIASVALGDELKESSRELMRILKERGIKPIMATGDNEEAAKAVAEELGIEYRSNQSPEDKYRLVEKLKAEGLTVIMVGDGVNDAPSLALADVGVAIGAGTQVALDSADVILTQSNPGDIESFISLSHRTSRKMKENLLWGAGYNFLAIPLAAGILYPIGISLTPAIGAILMSLSTVIVAVNAMLLKID